MFLVPKRLPFWEPFSWKFDKEIDAKFDTEKVMDFDEKSMRKWSHDLICFEKAFNGKNIFFEKRRML